MGINFILGDREVPCLLCHSVWNISVLLVLLFPLWANSDRPSSSVSGKSKPVADISPLNSLMNTESRKYGTKIFPLVSLLTWDDELTSQEAVRPIVLFLGFSFLTHGKVFLCCMYFLRLSVCFLSSPSRLTPLISVFRTYLCLLMLFLSAALDSDFHFLVHTNTVLITFWTLPFNPMWVVSFFAHYFLSNLATYLL